jgi:hypothetical protein
MGWDDGMFLLFLAVPHIQTKRFDDPMDPRSGKRLLPRFAGKKGKT